MAAASVKSVATRRSWKLFQVQNLAVRELHLCRKDPDRGTRLEAIAFALDGRRKRKIRRDPAVLETVPSSKSRRQGTSSVSKGSRRLTAVAAEVASSVPCPR